MDKIAQKFFELSLDIFCVADKQGYLLNVNPAWERVLGWSASELVGKKFYDFVVPDDREITANAAQSLLKGEVVYSFENRYYHKSGDVRVLSWSSIATADDGLIYAVARDVTELKRDYQLMTQTEKAALIGGWEVDCLNKKIYWTNETHVIHETDPLTYRPSVESALSFFPETYKDLMTQSFVKLMETGEPYDIECDFISAKGHKKRVRAIGKATFANGICTKVYGTFQDITVLHRMHVDILQNNDRLEAILEGAHLGAWDWYLQDNRVVFDRRWCKMLGLVYENTPMELKTWDQLIHPEDREQAYQDVRDHIEGKTEFYENTHRLKHANGSWVWILDKGRITAWDSSGQPIRFSGTHLNVTKQKELEEQLELARIQQVESTRLTLLGEMSSSIAHEINNPLTIISGYATTISHMIEKGDLSVEKLGNAADRITQTSLRIAKIIRGLRAFAREGGNDPFVSHSVSIIIEDVLELGRERFRVNGIELIQPIVPAHLQVECRSVQISQALLNLLNNAFDAVVNTQDAWVQLEVEDLGDWVQFAVMDSGKGIPADIAQKMMRPFFTTKDVGKGTGLGLSISSGIIANHNGSLFLDQSSQQTRFVIKIPKYQTVQKVPGTFCMAERQA